jgi:uncharacterized protein (TIGR01319 family)
VANGRWAWLFDVGSTFTKLSVVDLDEPSRHLRAQAPTTVATDVRHGFLDAVGAIETRGGPEFAQAAFRAASSSAAGGLALVVSGLVPRLSAEAGRVAALGAGAKLVGSWSYRLTAADVLELDAAAPDLVLLTGGTDGGDRQTLMDNARALATWERCPAVIVAGNREVSGDAACALMQAGIRATALPNILPQLDRLEIEPVRQAIRDEFLSTIVHAKGIDGIRGHLDADILPTPGVVLDGVRLLADERFGGGLMAIEVGGATTNVHSWSTAAAADGVVLRGLPEPALKRTVEGDLGVRWNAETIIELAGPAWFERAEVDDHAALSAYGAEVRARPAALPSTDVERHYDALLATYAAQLGILRHCGRHQQVMLPTGPVCVQSGKDLRSVSTLIATGGSIINARAPHGLIAAALRCQDPFALLPDDPDVLIDTNYALYAIGLLAQAHPQASIELASHALVQSASAAV